MTDKHTLHFVLPESSACVTYSPFSAIMSDNAVGYIATFFSYNVNFSIEIFLNPVINFVRVRIQYFIFMIIN